MRLARTIEYHALLAGALILLVGSDPALAQTPDSLLVGDCHEYARPRDTSPRAEEILEVGNVRATIYNHGALFWDHDGVGYEIPRGSGLHSEFNVNLIIGGRVEDSLRVAGTEFGPQEFWPGVVDDDGYPTADCYRYNRIWKIDRQTDLYPAADSAGITDAVRDWPVEIGAPFVDADHDGRYDPESGDMPRLLGDQMLWWVMNDRGGRHMKYGTLPLGVEVRGAAYGFNDAGPLSNTTFYRYEITNRNDAPIDSFFVGWVRDADLGAAFDDYIGTDTTLGLAYSYNADNDDDGRYGEAPPANGFLIIDSENCLEDYARLNAPGAINCWTDGLSAHIRYFDCCGVIGAAPRTAAHWHQFMNGRWGDGSPLNAAVGLGAQLAPDELSFMYPGDPVTGEWWSERNIDGNGTANRPSDRRSTAGSRGRPLAPGETRVITIALVWSRGASNLDSVRKLRADTRIVREGSNIWVAPYTPDRIPPPSPDTPAVPLAASIFPNPVVDAATLRLGVPQSSDVRVGVFDAIGRRVHAVVDARLDAGDRRFTLPAAEWSPGVYFVRIQLDHITETRLLVVGR